VPVSGAVIVTTPQDIALLDAKKGLKMFEKVNVPVLGIVENMAIHVCSSCGHAEHIFGEGGGARMSEQFGVPLLGSLPLDIHIREQADSGMPTVVAMPDSEAANRYKAIARQTAARLSQQARNKKLPFPNIAIDGQGVITIDDQPFAEAALSQKLATIAAQPQPEEGRRIYLRADKGLDYGRVMKVMGELNRAGLNRVALVSVGGDER